VNVLGTKLFCEICGAQVVVIHEGEGTVECHGAEMRTIAGGDSPNQESPRVRTAESGDDDVEYF
jgi:hypothetical protein